MRERKTYQGLSDFRRERIIQAQSFEESPDSRLLSICTALKSAEDGYTRAKLSGNIHVAGVMADLLEIKRAKLRAFLDCYFVC